MPRLGARQFEFCPFTLRLQTPISRGASGLRRDPSLLHQQRVAKKGDETLHCIRPIHLLTSSALRRDFQHAVFIDSTGELRSDSFALLWLQSCGVIDVEKECYPGRDFIHILTAGTAAARRGEYDFVLGNLEPVKHSYHDENAPLIGDTRR